PGVSTAGVDADLQESRIEAGRLTRDADVACEHEVHAGTDRRSVYRRDGGERRAQDAEEALVDVGDLAPVVIALRLRKRTEVRHVGSRTERGWFAGDDDRGRGAACFERVERRDDLLDHLRGHCVATLGVDERDDRNRVAIFDPDVFHQSGRTTAGEWRKKS